MHKRKRPWIAHIFQETNTRLEVCFIGVWSVVGALRVAAFGMMSNRGKVCIFVIPTPVAKVKCQSDGSLQGSHTVVQFCGVTQEREPVFGPHANATNECFHGQCFEGCTAASATGGIWSGMPADHAHGIGPETACPIDPHCYPRNMCGIVGLVGDVTIIDEQAPQANTGLFKVLTELFEAVIRWVINVKMAELEHCVAMFRRYGDGIFKAHYSWGWLEDQGIRCARASGFNMANQRVEGPCRNASQMRIARGNHAVGALRLRSLSIP